MNSEVVPKENEVNSQVKELVDTKVTSKENGSEPTLSGVLKNDGFEEAKISKETKAESEVQIDDKSEDSNGLVKSCESENKENEKPSDEDLEIKKKRAEELLLEGKRNLVIRDYHTAVNSLSEACNLFGTVYGEPAEECADVYFTYGCALLELAKGQMNTVGLEEKDDQESNQEDSVTEIEKLNEVEEKSTEKGEKSADDENQDNEEEDENPDEEDTPEEEEKPDEEDIEKDDDFDDLQLAWEMFELAKAIYKNQNTEESKLKLAKVLMKCGEVSLESEKFETAIDDMTESLQIRRYLLPEDSRIIAETQFQLGLTLEMSGSYSQAIELLNNAVAVLEQRIKNLENSSDENSKAEIAEIKTIIPEIHEKIVEINQHKQTTITAFMEAVGAVRSEATNGSSFTIKKVSNINHLVRKRPKQDVTSGSVPNKVPKMEESTSATKQ